MSYTFWQGIKSMRSVAYFKNALDSGSTKDLQEKWKEDPSWRNRVILSGVICVSTVALFGRSIYRKAKASIKKHKAKKEERRKELLTNDFDEGKTLSAPVVREQADVQYKDDLSEIEDETPTKVYYHEEKQINDIDAAFETDAIPNERMYRLKGNLMKMRVITTKVDRPNCIMIANGDDMYYMNGSGIFDKDHNSYFIAGKNETLAISKLIQHKEKAVINDFFSMFESF